MNEDGTAWKVKKEQMENNINHILPDSKNNQMPIFTDHGRTYYTRRTEVEAIRRKGDKVYYEPGLGYYIRRPRRKDPWEI